MLQAHSSLYTLIHPSSQQHTHQAAAPAAAAAVACDGAYLYIWDAARAALEKVGTGRRGTVAGKVYLRNADVLRVVKLLAPGASEPAVHGGALSVAANDGGGGGGDDDEGAGPVPG